MKEKEQEMEMMDEDMDIVDEVVTGQQKNEEEQVVVVEEGKEEQEELSPPLNVNDPIFVQFLKEYGADQNTIAQVEIIYNNDNMADFHFQLALKSKPNEVRMSLKNFFQSINTDQHEVKTESTVLQDIIKGLDDQTSTDPSTFLQLVAKIMAFFEVERLTKDYKLFPKQSSSSSSLTGQSIAALKGFTKYLLTPAGDRSPLDVVEMFLKHVNHCFTEYEKLNSNDKESYYSPYFTLCQSSGYGKTRLIMEFKRRYSSDYSVVYICLRQDTADGWPKERSKVIADLILKQQDNFETFWVFIIRAVAKVVREKDEWFNELDLFFNTAQEQETFWNTIYHEYENLIKDQQKKKGEEKKSGDSQLATTGEDTVSSSSHQAAGGKTGGTKTVKRKPILLVFDEASTLLTSGKPRTVRQEEQEEVKAVKQIGLFLDLRRALAHEFAAHQVMAILLDTNSSLHNFQPLQKLDSSSRAVGGRKLLPPFYTMPPLLQITSADIESSDGLTDDLYKMEIQYSGSGQNNILAKELSIIYKPLDQLLLSRPLFASCALDILQKKPFGEESLSERMLLKEISIYVQFASSKLTMIKDKSSLPPENVLLDETMVLAILSPRCYLESTSLVARSNLIKQHMGTCCWVSEDRSTISVRYPSEPALVAGSMYAVNQYFQPPAAKTYEDLFASFSSLVVAKCILYSPGGVGEMGELLAQLVLCQAHDAAVGKFLPASTRFVDYAGTEDKPDDDVPMKGPATTSQVSTTTKAMPTSEATAAQTPAAALLWRPLPLLAMLSSLFAENDVKDMRSRLESNNLSTLCDAMVFSTHFIKISNYSLRVDQLSAFLKRGASAVLQNGDAGIDIVVPLMLPRMKEEEQEKVLQRERMKSSNSMVMPAATSEILKQQERTNKSANVQQGIKIGRGKKEAPVGTSEKKKMPMNVNDIETFVTSAHVYQIKNWISRSPDPVEVIGQAFNHPLCRELLLNSTPFVLTLWNVAPVPFASKLLGQQSILHVKSEPSLSEQDSWRVAEIEDTSDGCYTVLIGVTPKKKKVKAQEKQQPKKQRLSTEIDCKILFLQMAGLNDSSSSCASLSQIPCLSTQPRITELMKKLRRNDEQWHQLAKQQKDLNYGGEADVHGYMESLSVLEWKTPRP